MNIEIKYLADVPEYEPQVFALANKEFGNGDKEYFFREIFKRSMNKDKLPICFVSFVDGRLAGSVSLWRADILLMQDLCPWLSALVVAPEFRGCGVGIRLQEFLIDFCKEKGYEDLHLCTKIDGYYEKTGFEYVCDAERAQNEYIKIYKKIL